MATKHNTNRRWSSNVTYTGLTKIHSDILSGATARNTLVNRRTSCTLTTESNMHQKELRSLDLNRQALKNSMLAYTQKMKTIADEKSRFLSHHPTEHIYMKRIMTRARTNVPKAPKAVVTDAFLRPASHATTLNRRSQAEEQSDDDQFSKQLFSTQNDTLLDPRGRVSIDSGISVGSGNDCPETVPDSSNQDYSDSYCSDSESVGSWSCRSTRSDNHSTSKKCIKLDDGPVSDSETPTTENILCQRRSRRRKWRVSREKPQLPTVLDNESTDDERALSPACNNNSDVSIMPFPLDSCYTNPDEPEAPQSNVMGPLSTTEYRFFRVRSASEERKQEIISAKPKPAQSPSVAATRLRRPRQKQKQDTKPGYHRFRYSQLMDTTTTSEKQARPSSHLGASASGHIPLMDSIQELSPDLEREDSFSESLFEDTIAHLEIISERSDRVLKSVLKKENFVEPHGRKHVHFFLPDIFKR